MAGDSAADAEYRLLADQIHSMTFFIDGNKWAVPSLKKSQIYFTRFQLCLLSVLLEKMGTKLTKP